MVSLLPQMSYSQQTFKVYHGLSGRSQLLNPPKDKTIPVNKNSNVCFEVVNAHPVYYTYKLNIDIDSVENENPIFDEALVNAFNTIAIPNSSIEVSKTDTISKIKPILINKQDPKKFIKEPFTVVSMRKSIQDDSQNQIVLNNRLFNLPRNGCNDCRDLINNAVDNAINEYAKQFENKIDNFNNTLTGQEDSLKRKIESANKKIAQINDQTSFINNYINELNKYQELISKIDTIIITSDEPELITSLKYISYPDEDRGFDQAVRKIRSMYIKKDWKTSADIKKTFDELHAKKVSEAKLRQFDESRIELIKPRNEQIRQKLELYFNLYANGQTKLSVTNCFFMGNQNTTVELVSEKNENTYGHRQAGTLTQKYILKPKFERPVLELIPMISYAISKEVPKFSLNNEVIVEESDGVGTFRVGTVLLGNFWRFGTFEEQAFGLGAGFNVTDDPVGINNFYITTMYSFRNIFRIGLGIGADNIPSGLKNNLEPGDRLSQELGDLDDLDTFVNYKNHLGLFITVTVTGFNLPILTKL